MADAATQTRYQVGGMDCAACEAKIDTAVRRMPGVTDVSVSAAAGTLLVEHDGSGDLAAIERRVSGMGYTVAPAGKAQIPHDDHDHDDGDGHGHDHAHAHGPTSGPWWKSGRGMLTLASGAGLAAAFVVGWLAPGLAPWAFGAAMLIGLVPIGRRAVMAALAGTPFSIEMLMLIAAIGAVLIGAVEEAATVVFLFLVGEMLEGVAAGRARASIQGLAQLVPKTAWLDEDGATREVPADSLAPGALILVRPGDRIPADGEITRGSSAINEAPVTGESTPVHKQPGAQVFAGTVNGDGALRVRVTAAAADNTIARVVQLVEEAQERKAPTERFIARFSRWYTPGVVVVAALVATVPPLLAGGAWDAWIYKGLAILLIGCPCALVISTPAAVAASLASGARRGLLLKGGAVLERLGAITAVAFDKTGTLTRGTPVVTDVLGFARSKADVLRLAAAVEAGSSHPLAKAILDEAASRGLSVPPATDARSIGGKGVVATVDGDELFLGSPQAAGARVALSPEQEQQVAALNQAGKSCAVLVAGGAAAGAIAMRDEPREDAKAGLDALARAGVTTVMLTGDNRRTAEAIGEQLGITVRAELLPEDKQRIVGEMQAEGLVVAKVGDGINDAPALAAADVGIAMGGGTDVALETADAAVLHGRVADVAALIALSQRTMGNIRQNITIALGLKAVFLVTTVLGVTGLWPAILADTGATVLVTLNAVRLLAPARSSFAAMAASARPVRPGRWRLPGRRAAR